MNQKLVSDGTQGDVESTHHSYINNVGEKFLIGAAGVALGAGAVAAQ